MQPCGGSKEVGIIFAKNVTEGFGFGRDALTMRPATRELLGEQQPSQLTCPSNPPHTREATGRAAPGGGRSGLGRGGTR
jgi:hypothetical protein